MAAGKSLIYLLRRPPERRLSETVRRQIARGVDVRVALVQAAVGERVACGAPVIHLEEDAVRFGVTGSGEGVSAGELLDLLYQADAVVVW